MIANGPTSMRDGGNVVPAATFHAWYELLAEDVALDPHGVSDGTSRAPALLLHDLIVVGVARGALGMVVSHSSGPRGFAHLSFRYPFAPEFDWSGGIDLSGSAGETALRGAELIAALERATGVLATDMAAGERSMSEA